MTITAHVHDHRIVLPADLEVPEGAEVQVILPDTVADNTANTATDEKDGNPMAWMQEFVGAINTLPVDAAERHNELAHGRKRRLL